MVKYLHNFSIQINNALLRWQRKKCNPQDMMILLPRCLQNSVCTQNVVEDSLNCKQCGKCHIGDVVSLGKQYGIRVLVATGGLMAREYIKKYTPRLIVAIACEGELLDGMFKIFPKPVYALVNSRPHGPCKDTCIDAKKVEQAIQMFRK